ncbi:helix-turn-helix transcriptional regulator [Roseobacteraceae bacterium NS-SX3]
MPDLLEYMRTSAPFQGALVCRLNLSNPPEHVYDNVCQERRTVVVDRWLERAWLLDPFVVSFISERHAPVMVLRDAAPDRFAGSDYFKIYYRSLRLKDEMAVFVTLPDNTLFFSLGPVVGKTRFARRDVRSLLDMHPVIAALCEQHFHRTPRYQAGGPYAGQLRNVTLASTVETLCPGLTRREAEVVEHILLGHSSQSIALLLEVSPATIKVHRKNIYKKLGISSQSALFSIFLQSVVE